MPARQERAAGWHGQLQHRQFRVLPESRLSHGSHPARLFLALPRAALRERHPDPRYAGAPVRLYHGSSTTQYPTVNATPRQAKPRIRNATSTAAIAFAHEIPFTARIATTYNGIQ